MSIIRDFVDGFTKDNDLWIPMIFITIPILLLTVLLLPILIPIELLTWAINHSNNKKGKT